MFSKSKNSSKTNKNHNKSTKLLIFLDLITKDLYEEMQSYLIKRQSSSTFENRKISIYQDIKMICAFKKYQMQLQSSKSNQRINLQKQIIKQLAQQIQLKESTINERIGKKLPNVAISVLTDCMRRNVSLNFTGKKIIQNQNQKLKPQEIIILDSSIKQPDSDDISIQQPKKSEKSLSVEPFIQQKSCKNFQNLISLDDRLAQINTQNQIQTQKNSLYRYGSKIVSLPIKLVYNKPKKQIFCYKKAIQKNQTCKRLSLIAESNNPIQQEQLQFQNSKILHQNLIQIETQPEISDIDLLKQEASILETIALKLRSYPNLLQIMFKSQKSEDIKIFDELFLQFQHFKKACDLMAQQKNTVWIELRVISQSLCNVLQILFAKKIVEKKHLKASQSMPIMSNFIEIPATAQQEETGWRLQDI